MQMTNMNQEGLLNNNCVVVREAQAGIISGSSYRTGAVESDNVLSCADGDDQGDLDPVPLNFTN
jgi:hypothetical protein